MLGGGVEPQFGAQPLDQGLELHHFGGQALVVGDYQGFVHLLDPEDGSFMARIPTDGSAISIEARPVDRGFVIQTRSGGVYAMGVVA